MLIVAIFRARKSGLLRLRKVVTPVGLNCRVGRCGKCCSAMGGEITVKIEEVYNYASSDIIKKKNNLIVLKDKCGKCVYLVDSKCQIYPKRPKSCQDYPWYNINSTLYYDVGCPGIVFDVDKTPSVAEITPIFEYLHRSKKLQKILVWLFTHW